MNFLEKRFKRTCYFDCKKLLNCYDEINILEKEAKTAETVIRFVNEMSNIISCGEEVIYISENIDDYFIVTLLRGFKPNGTQEELTFYAYAYIDGNVNLNKVVTLYAKIHYNKDCNFIDHIEIIDIESGSNNGYGSLIMKEFVKYIKPTKARYITGCLSSVDLFDEDDPEHKERLYHFYKKFGFEIYDDGSLYLKL